MKRPQLSALALALLFSSASAPVSACGYDGRPLDLAAAHPSSLAVALAIHDAYQEDLFIKPFPLQGGFGMRRAVMMLEKLRAALAPIAGSKRFNLLLVEPGLWTRFEREGESLTMTTHTTKPDPDEVVVITGEGVLIALESGRLSIDQALDNGVLRIEAGGRPHEALVLNWRQAFATPVASNQP